MPWKRGRLRKPIGKRTGSITGHGGEYHPVEGICHQRFESLEVDNWGGGFYHHIKSEPEGGTDNTGRPVRNVAVRISVWIQG